MCNLLDVLQAYVTDQIKSVGSSTGVMTPSFTILSNSALTLGCTEPIWELFDEVLCRLDLNCLLGRCWHWSGTSQLGSALDDLESTVHFDNFQSLT